MNILSDIKIELLKIKRTKTFLHTIFIIMIAVLWAISASINYLNRADEKFLNIIIANFIDLNIIFLPIVISLITNKICDIEHKHQTFKYMKAIGINKSSIFKSKFIFLFINLSFMIIIETVFIIILSNLYNIRIDKNLIRFILGNIVSVYILNSLFLFIAIEYKNKFFLLSSGIIGGFIGIILSRLPIFIRAIIPFGIISVLSPIDIKYNEITKKIVYYDKNNFILLLIYFIIGVLLYKFLKKYIDKEEY